MKEMKELENIKELKELIIDLMISLGDKRTKEEILEEVEKAKNK
jgi:hypothetical protein